MGRVEQGGLWVHMVERVGRTAENKKKLSSNTTQQCGAPHISSKKPGQSARLPLNSRMEGSGG